MPMTKLSPIISEFETETQAAAHDAWFRAKVEAALADTRAPVPHDAAMAEIQKIIDERKAH